MRMQAVTAFGGLTGRANVKPDLIADMDVLVWAFRNPAANDGKVLFLVASGGMGINKCSFARL